MKSRLCPTCLFHMPYKMEVIDPTKCFVCGKENEHKMSMEAWAFQLEEQRMWALSSGLSDEEIEEILKKWHDILDLEFGL